MNNLKNKAGFTLVELIVVIAILAILAGVAIPAYSGYITKANDAADLTALSAILTAAQGAQATSTNGVTAIDVTTDGDGEITDISVNGDAVYDADGANDAAKWPNADFALYINETVPTLKGSYKIGAEWATATGWEAK